MIGEDSRLYEMCCGIFGAEAVSVQPIWFFLEAQKVKSSNELFSSVKQDLKETEWQCGLKDWFNRKLEKEKSINVWKRYSRDVLLR